MSHIITNHQVFCLILSQMACMMSYKSRLKNKYKKNQEDGTICPYQGYFQLMYIIGTQSKCKLYWSVILCLPIRLKHPIQEISTKIDEREDKKLYCKENINYISIIFSVFVCLLPFPS